MSAKQISCLIALWLAFASAPIQAAGDTSLTELDDRINLLCLRMVLPAPARMHKDESGQIWLETANGARILYAGAENRPDQRNADLRASMRQEYPLEPARPETPAGFAPGRQRPYQLYALIYGRTAEEVKRGLIDTPFYGKKIRLHAHAARAFQRALPELERLAKNSSMRPYLIPEGGFYWRKIAGEPFLSAHSYGIALDIGVDKAPYWRWSKQMPHPLQKTYPAAIVGAMEKQGFIWGGKWHEYDLMHFEYRPELICKARVRKAFAGGKFPRVALELSGR